MIDNGAKGAKENVEDWKIDYKMLPSILLAIG